MTEGLELQGRPAAAGIAAGPLVLLADCTVKRAASGRPEIEKRQLESALASAMMDLSRLIARVEGAGRDILAFQHALLEDEALTTDIFRAIADGMSADAAWLMVLDRDIGGYHASDDEYFRARAADLRDLRDRVLRHLEGGGEASFVPGTILASDDVGPTLFLEMDWSKGGGLLLTAGSASSHVAMLARARGVPMVVGLGHVNLGGHSNAIIDGETGKAILSPSDEQRSHYAAKLTSFNCKGSLEKAFLRKPARSKDGVQIELLINVNGIDDIEQVDSDACDGIGLMRTEFLFADGMPLPDEEQQYVAYRKLLEWAGNRPVTIRTLDVGGDKPVAGLTTGSERNPFLGVRGIRLMLARPDVFRSQLKALARAAVHGNLKVMLPMVTIAEEVSQSARLLDEVIEKLRAENVPCARPSLGIMVEVPAVAVAPELYAEAAFFSIGSNDLTQYVMASARDEPGVSHLNDPTHIAIMRLIGSVTEFCRIRNIPVSLCGDMASDPRHLEALLRAGLRSISVSPAAIGRVKAALSEIALNDPCRNP
jgi:phosphoenolpyruvate-protein phosphotransferase (PTS system enzyme I)